MTPQAASSDRQLDLLEPIVRNVEKQGVPTILGKYHRRMMEVPVLE